MDKPYSIHNDHTLSIRNGVRRRMRLDLLHIDWAILFHHLKRSRIVDAPVRSISLSTREEGHMKQMLFCVGLN